MTTNATKNSNIKLFASDKNWIEGEAIQQLEKTATLEGMERVIAMPDLHPGKGTPIGAAFFSTTRIYPYLIGNDIGCGMALWKTDLRKNKIKIDRFLKKLEQIKAPWDGDPKEKLDPCLRAYSDFDRSLGTVGGGNHFAELQTVEKVMNPESFSEMGLEKNSALLLVHSGSRGVGERILREHIQQFKSAGLEVGGKEADEYLKKHQDALSWAATNREVIAERFLDAINVKGEPVLDAPHNLLAPVALNGINGYLHRKGAAPSDQGALVVPGSRGALSYLVKPVGDQQENGFSVAHGAGRKFKRSEMKARFGKRFQAKELLKTDLGSRVICDDKNLLFEEAPPGYKNIEQVVLDLVEFKLIEVIATMRPVITFKAGFP